METKKLTQCQTHSFIPSKLQKFEVEESYRIIVTQSSVQSSCPASVGSCMEKGLEMRVTVDLSSPHTHTHPLFPPPTHPPPPPPTHTHTHTHQCW